MRVRLTLLVGLALAMLAVGLILSESPVVVARANSIAANWILGETTSDARACQAGEVLPAGASAIRLSLFSNDGPSVRVRAMSAGRVVASGATPGGWGDGSVTVPVRPVPRTASAVQVCFGLGHTKEKVTIYGSPASRAVGIRTSDGQSLPGRMKIEYLRLAHSSWWSLIQTVGRRLGLGRAPGGTWVALLVAVLMGAIVSLGAWLTVRELS